MAVLQSRHLNLRSSIDSGAILLLTCLASRYDQHACGQNGSTVCRPLPFAESTGTHTRSPASPGTCCWSTDSGIHIQWMQRSGLEWAFRVIQATAACPATRSAARSSSIPARRRRPVPAKRRPHCHRQPARCHDHCIGPAVWHADFRRHTYPHQPAPACRTGRGTPPSPPYSRYGPAHRTLNQLRPRGCCVSVPS